MPLLETNGLLKATPPKLIENGDEIDADVSSPGPRLVPVIWR
jgi:hypothetical protein